jgi:hypothetical protein
VTVLASFPGSGNTWARLLLEYASGHFSGSIYHDAALAPLLPAEGDASSRVVVVKAHTPPDHYLATIVSPAVRAAREDWAGAPSGEDWAGAAPLLYPLASTWVRRVVLLVRHPFDAVWSEYQRRETGGRSHVQQVGEAKSRGPKSVTFFLLCVCLFVF